MDKAFAILQTKFHPPAMPVHFVARPELLNRLDERRQRPLTLVSAPAGYGKSTLVSSWLAASDCPAVWISLDESDNSLSQFLVYLLSGLQRIAPDIGRAFKNWLRATELPPVEVMAHDLINELDGIPHNFILTLDDYHTIRNQEIHDLIGTLLQHPPRPIHLVLVNRRDPPLPISRLRAQGKVTEVRVQDLRFSTSETANFFQKVTQAPVGADLAQKLETKTEGWAAGLRLIAISMRHRGDVDRMVTKLPDDSRYVMDYLVTEVLTRQDKIIQDYLLKTALLDRFCASLCEAIGDGIQSPESSKLSGVKFLKWLQAANLFVIPLDDRQQWFRYHHLFQSLLNHRLNQQFSQDEINALHKRAALWFAREGLIEEALRHYLSAGDVAAAAKLISDQRHTIMNAEHWHRLERWLDMLPADRIEKEPDLLLLKAWLCEYRVRLNEMRPYIEKAAPHIERIAPEDPPEKLSLKAEYDGLCAFLAYIEGDGAGTVSQALQSLKKIAPEAYSVRSWSYLMLAIGHQMRGELKLAHDVIAKASEIDTPPGTTYHARLSLALCFINWIEADLPSLRQSTAKALSLCKEADLPDSIGIATYFKGAFHYLRNELDQVDAHLDAVVEEDYAPNLLNWMHSAFILALSLQGRGQLTSAQKMADRISDKALSANNNEMYRLAEAFQAELALYHGNLKRAESWCLRFDPRPFNPGYRYYQPQFTLVKALLSMGTKPRVEKAAELLLELHDYYQSIHNVRCLIDVCALQALVFDRQDNEQAAVKALGKAVDLSRKGHLIRPFLDLGQPMADLLAQFAVRLPASDFVVSLQTAFAETEGYAVQTPNLAKVKQPPAVSNQTLSNPLTNREFEILLLLADRKRDKEIAAHLCIATETVKKHTRNIYRKLDVTDRQKAVAAGFRLGLLETRRL